ncbi:MAG: chorismate synthase [Flavobacteriales bacterium]|nr:chorismate synthase [Flavobacteriales bacterium]|tara:strand:+ start:2731 stop:3804 length:1074 start_codon:yes stop_codon:yes gene_type:complete
MGNSFGSIFKLTTFGESHGIAIGGVIDGCPSSMSVDFDFIQKQLDRRRPGQSEITTQRKESDKVEFLSGIFEGKTTGTPISFIIKNKDSKSNDYSHLKESFRPSHADFTYQKKYGIRDYRGGGRASARETACRVVAGAIAQQVLATIGVQVSAYVSAVGSVRMNKSYNEINLSFIDNNVLRCPDNKYAEMMRAEIEQLKKEGDTIGGEITVIATGVAPGWGEPVFSKLHAELGKAMLSINAVHAFKYGFGGVDISSSKGSVSNDVIIDESGTTRTNFSGGIQGGISNGNDIYCEVAFKPVATIMKKQESIDLDGNQIELESKGRHDTCVVPRAVPIVESMMALTLTDYYLKSKINKI